MTKLKFLKKLSYELGCLEKRAREKSLSYYSEIIDDRIESGLSEELAVLEMEDISVIALGIINDSSGSVVIKPKTTPLSIVRTIICFSLLVIILVIICFVIISLLTGELFLFASGLLGCVNFLIFLSANQARAFMILAIGLLYISSGLFLFFPSFLLSKWMISTWLRVFRRRVIVG